jgi:hypothetical protein
MSLHPNQAFPIHIHQPSSAPLPLRILLLHQVLIRRVPLRLRLAHILNPPITSRALQQLATLRIVVSGLLHGGLADFLRRSLHRGAVDGVVGGLMQAAVAGCGLTVGGDGVARRGEADRGGAGEGVGGHCVVVWWW